MTDLSHIVKMVNYKCRELENPVTETLAAYVAQTMLNKGKLSVFLLTRCSHWTFLLGSAN